MSESTRKLLKAISENDTKNAKSLLKKVLREKTKNKVKEVTGEE